MTPVASATDHGVSTGARGMGIPSSTAVLVKSSRRDDPNPDRCNELPVEPASASEYWSLHADPVAITSGPR